MSIKTLNFPNIIRHLMNLPYYIGCTFADHYHANVTVDTCTIVTALIKSLILTVFTLTFYLAVFLTFCFIFHTIGLELFGFDSTIANIVTGVLVIFVTVVTIFGGGFLVQTAIDYYKYNKDRRLMKRYRTEPSAISTLWYSVRNKVCIPVTFEKKNEE